MAAITTRTGLRERSPYLFLVFLLLCLTLCATVIGLAVKYVQTFRHLANLEASHRIESSELAQQLQSGADLLESARKDLKAARAELEKVKEFNTGLNSSLLQAQRDVTTCTARRKEAEDALRDERLKMEQWKKDICPNGWLLYEKSCLWFSAKDELKTWWDSKNSCENVKAKMLVVPRNDAALQAFLADKGHDFWVGKETWNRWPDGYTKQYDYWKISKGELQHVDSYRAKNRWICEKSILIRF